MLIFSKFTEEFAVQTHTDTYRLKIGLNSFIVERSFTIFPSFESRIISPDLAGSEVGLSSGVTVQYFKTICKKR